jgi:hypothetical protein
MKLVCVVGGHVLMTPQCRIGDAEKDEQETSHYLPLPDIVLSEKIVISIYYYRVAEQK